MRVTKISAAAGVLLTLAAATSVAGQDIRLRARSTTGGIAKAQRWTPVLVDLESSVSTFQGELTLTFGDSVLRREIVLASPGRRQFEAYLRTGNPEGAVRVELTSAGVQTAVQDVAIRVVPIDEAVILCVMSADGAEPEERCTTTTTPELLPRSLRGYAAIDGVAWAAAGPRLSDEQRTALLRWRALRELEVSGHLSLGPTPTRPLLRRGLPQQSVRNIELVAGTYVVLLIFVGWITTRHARRLAVAFLSIGVVVGIGALAVYTVGRIAPANRIRLDHDSVLHQIPGVDASFVAMRGVLQFPTSASYEVRLGIPEGAIELPSSRGGTESRVDADGFPVITGVHGLGSRLSFAAEGTADAQPVSVTETGLSVTVANRTSAALLDCRFGAGFSKSEVGQIAAGESVTAQRTGEVWGPMFTCVAPTGMLELTAQDRPVEMNGATLIAVYGLPQTEAVPAGPRD